MNTTVRLILADAVGRQQRMDRLLRYATWSEADLSGFSQALAHQRAVDADVFGTERG